MTPLIACRDAIWNIPKGNDVSVYFSDASSDSTPKLPECQNLR